MRFFWIICGLVSLTIGAIGAVTPLLPTVPLVLLAAFCFAKGSNRLHQWLLSHAAFGPMIKDWQRSGAIGRSAKWMATGSILAAFGLSVVLQFSFIVLAIQAVVLGCVSVFIWSRPDH